jgi:hypothetical protein
MLNKFKILIQEYPGITLNVNGLNVPIKDKDDQLGV